MRFVFVTDDLPRSGSAGHLVMNAAMIEWLRASGHEVTVLLSRPRFRWPVERYAAAGVAGPGIGHWRGYVFATGLRDIGAILARNILSRAPLSLAAALRRKARAGNYGEVDEIIGAFISPAQAAWCAAHIRRLAPGGILIDTIFRAPLLQQPGLRQFNAVITAPDLFHRRHRAMLEAGYRVHPPQLTRAHEAELLCLGNAIAAIQPQEAAEIGAMCPNQPVCITPMPALPCPAPAAQLKIPGRLVFVGSDTLPNLDGLRWFLAEIWPLLQNLHHGITLDLVGDCGAAIGPLPSGIARLGRVDDLAGILHRARLAIAPLRVSSGLKIKMLDYARHGLFTVATHECLQGFAEDPHPPFIAAADAFSFATAIAAGLDRTGVEDQQTALDYVGLHYNFEASFAGLAALLKITPNAGG